MTVDDFFQGDPEGLRIFAAIASRVAGIGPTEMRVTKSEIAFRRNRGFAFVWRPDKYLGHVDVPAVLSIALPSRETSARFKSVIHPSPRVWMHHLEVRQAREIDADVMHWLVQAYEAAEGTRAKSTAR